MTNEPAAAPEIHSRRFPAFAFPAFRAYWCGGYLSDVGNWAQSTTVPYVVLLVTGQPAWVGVAGFASLVAQVLAMLWGGRLADRPHRYTLLLGLNVAMALTAAALAVVVGVGTTEPWAIVALFALGAWFHGLQSPTWQSMATDLVPADVAPNAAHATIMKYQAARATGPLIGGALLAGPGAAWALGVNALSFFFLLAAVVRLKRLAPQALTPPPATTGQRHSLVGVLRVPVLGLAVALTAIVALLGLPIVQLTAVLADDVYLVGAGAYGVLLSAFGVGSLLGAASLTAWRSAPRRSRGVAASLAGFGLALVVAGTVPVYGVGLVAVFLTGAGFSLTTSQLHAAIQLSASPAQRGRALSLYLIALRGGSALGVLALAWLAGVASASLALGAAGVALLMVAVLVALSPRVRMLD